MAGCHGVPGGGMWRDGGAQQGYWVGQGGGWRLAMRILEG